MYEPADLPAQANSIRATADADGPNGVPDAHAQISELLTIVERLESVVAAETVALDQHRLSEIVVFTRKKSQILLEVTRLMRLVKLPAADDQLYDRLRQLKSSLNLNRDMLDVQLRAATHLTSVISDAAQAAESDGTYSATNGGDKFR